MVRPVTVAVCVFFVGISFLASPARGQAIFDDDFEDAGICAWSNADQTDNDQDLYKICDFDCDDERDDVNPGEYDDCGDGIDNDCSGFADEVCCHPLLQNCSEIGDACYYVLEFHLFACAHPFGEPPGQQEDACMFQNSCEEGFGCTLCIPPDCGEDFVCAAFCDPAGDDCAAGETCLLYNQFWGNVNPVPQDFGMCVADTLIP